MTDLKPCPFCGAPLPFLIQADLGDWYVSCGACTQWARPLGAGTQELAIAAWNRRAPRFSPEEREAMAMVQPYMADVGTSYDVNDPDGDKWDKAAAVIRKMLEGK